MNREEIVSDVATATGLTKEQAKEAVDMTFTVMAISLMKGESIFVRGFGTFRPTEVKAGKGYDFKNKKQVIIPARKTVRLVVSKALKEKL